MTGTSLPYRPCAGIMVLNTENKVWMGHRLAGDGDEIRADDKRWQMPQGGIDKGEKPVDAAKRELWEETGLVLGIPGNWPGDAPADWQGFATTGHLPSADGLQYVFRALTPPGRPRRFDARFFLVDANHIVGDLDDFSQASDELSHLQWVKLSQARQFDLPFITEVVLAEVAARITDLTPPSSVPYFRNNDEASLFLRLHGKEMPNTG